MDFPEFIEEWNNRNDFIIVRTSGSTGTPKEIHLNKRFVMESAVRTNNYFNISQTSNLHSCVSADYIGGKMMAVRSLVSGANLSWETPSNRPLTHLPLDYSIDLLAIVPSQMLFILDNLKELPEIKNFLIGGAPINNQLKDKIANSGINAFESYGMTETASHIALRKITSQTIPFRTFDDISVSNNPDGCLVINYKDGLKITTNDIAEIISDKEFFIVGRKDNIINSGGKKINPEIIEKQISDYIEEEFIIAGLPDPKWGQKIVLIIEGENEKVWLDKLKEKLKQSLSGWQVPKDILLVKKLPRSKNGKIIRPKNPDDFSSFLL